MTLKPTEDPEGYPGDGELPHLSTEEQKRAMRDWFFHNFEDPAHSTPYESREGGYQYIWGGPYDAADEVPDRFGGVIDDELIQEAVNEIWSELPDAVPAEWRQEPDPDPDDYLSEDDEEDEIRSEGALRREVIQRLDTLEQAIEAIRNSDSPPGMGHNNPPESVEPWPISAEDLDALQASTRDVRAETQETQPDEQNIEQHLGFMRQVVGRVGPWLARKFDMAANEAAKSFGKSLGHAMAWGVPGYVAYLFGALDEVIQAVQNWLQLIGTVL